jgi:hypothetical protein
MLLVQQKDFHVLSCEPATIDGWLAGVLIKTLARNLVLDLVLSHLT